MKTVVTEIGSYQRKVEVEVDAKEVHPHIEKAYQKYQKKIHIDGFRKGKAPMSLVKKRFGDAIQAEVTDDLIQTFFRKALIEEKVAAVSAGKITDVSFAEGEDLKFTAEVEVEPVVEVKDYKGFKVEKEVMKVTDEDVKQTIDYLREQRAEKNEIDRGAEIGDIIEGDIQALDSSGVPIIGTKWDKSTIEIGKQPLGDMIQDQVVGVKNGDTARFSLKQPERQADGKVTEIESYYSMQVKSVKEKILPELDDEFAKTLGEYESVDALKSQITDNIVSQREQESKRMVRGRIADEIVKRNDFEVPPSMIENMLDSLWEDFQKNPDRDIEESQFREENKSGVVWNIKWHLIQQKIYELESIEVSDAEIDEEIDKVAKSASKEEKKIRSQMKSPQRRNRLKENLLQERLMEFLESQVKIKEVTVKPNKKKDSKIITS